MKASWPLEDTTISCGSGPAGTRPTILNVAGSTIARVFADFSRTRRSGEADCAIALGESKLKNQRMESAAQRKQRPNFEPGSFMAFPLAWKDEEYYSGRGRGGKGDLPLDKPITGALVGHDTWNDGGNLRIEQEP